MPNEQRVKQRETSSQGRVMVVRVLVVDDEPINRELISEILASEGYDVVTAQDGLEALDHLTTPLPDVIISDLRMPRMSGHEFLAVVRQRFPHVPVLAISGEFEGDAVPIGVPADAYLEKGAFTYDKLRSTITELISAPPNRMQAAVSSISPA